MAPNSTTLLAQVQGEVYYSPFLPSFQFLMLFLILGTPMSPQQGSAGIRSSAPGDQPPLPKSRLNPTAIARAAESLSL